jgi:uncharacterized protein YfkK (UPF0435 family)
MFLKKMFRLIHSRENFSGKERPEAVYAPLLQ